MLPAKPQWQKLIHWVSPLLVLSLGLHGLALLIPIPKKPEVREEPPETELLEPIRVSALPKPSLPESTGAESTGAESAAIAPPGLTQSPPAAAPPEPERSPEPAPRPSPSSVPAPAPALPVAPPAGDLGEADGVENVENADSSTGKPTKPDLVPQPYSDVGTTTGEAAAVLSELLSFNPTATGDPAPLKFIKHPLPLAFPAEDYCFKNYPEPPASVVVIVEKAQTGPKVVDGGITQKTGYETIDKWVDKGVFPTNQIDPNANTDVEIPDVADVDILEWMAGNINGPLFESDELTVAYTFGVKVTLVGNPCR
ncbi:hypothetical protein [Leptolyngbya sp. BC1307]|uniref:hypothetical protein n=1 Tax=Leptolyngbya sp. BC1307 TaxID=2029589 RepID=UPI000EFAFC94|nr:hypothetical protein [Leptolyngbya sp. BC1307]